MGAIYHLYNHTKNIIVSYYWKNDEFCDIHEVMHRYRWKYSDVIISVGGCDYYLFKHNETTNQMKPVRQNINTLNLYNSLNSINLEFGGHVDNQPKQEIITDTKIYTLNDISSNESESESESIPETTNIIDHVPIWNSSNCCEVCDYQFNVNDINSDIK